MTKKSLATTLDSDMVHVRLPDGMRSQLRVLAASRGRTMNAEIVAALTDWLGRDERPQTSADTLDALMELQARQVAEIAEIRTMIEAKMSGEMANASRAAEAPELAVPTSFLDRPSPPPPKVPNKPEGLDAVDAALNLGDVKGALLAIAQMPDVSIPTNVLDAVLQTRKAKNSQS